MDARALPTPSPRASAPASPLLIGMPSEPPQKLKGRQRLLQGLQRMSSSPSLAKMGRTRSSDKVYRPNHKASISCVSLGSSPQGSSISPPIQANSSTFVTPPGTPGTPSSSTSYLDAQTGRYRPFDIGSAATSSEHLQLRTNKTTLHEISEKPLPRRENFNFWADLPQEIRINILSYLTPKEIIRVSAVSKAWQEMCFDGQLWTVLDCQTYYQKITSEALMKIMLRAGAFVKNLNLRGCVQLRDQWLSLGTRMTNQECRNLETFSIEGCKIERSSIHFFLLRNPKLLHLNMPSMQQVSNATLKIVAAHCRNLELLNINWCTNCDNKGLLKVIQSCPNLTDLRASEVRGLDDPELALELFKRNNLERFILAGCESLTDESLKLMVQGENPTVDILTDRVEVPPRRWRHLDISECRQITDDGVKTLAHNVPFMEGLKLCKNSTLTDDGLFDLMGSMPRLTHLELEDLDQVTNHILVEGLAKSEATRTLEHLSLSYCEQLGDVGVMAILKACQELKLLCVDNTRISDLVLMEASDQVRKRGNLTKKGARPRKGLELIAFDCANVTWAGVREIMQGNNRVLQGRKKSVVKEVLPLVSGVDSETDTMSAGPSASASQEIKRVIEIQTLLFPAQTIHLKSFHVWQPTVDAHYQRCMTARWAAAARLEGKWAEWMIATEEVGNLGHGWGARRRRRRQREAENRVREDTAGLVHDTDGPNGTGTETEDMSGFEGGPRRPNRRRARSGGCVVM